MNRRVALLEQEQERAAAFEQPWNWWSFKVQPTCPPSTSIRYPADYMFGDCYRRQSNWSVEAATCDLTDSDDSGLSITFANAGYYTDLTLQLRDGGEFEPAVKLVVYNSGSEYATAAEAENAAYPDVSSGVLVGEWLDDYPLCIVIARNNGNTAEENQFMPIDNVNRGRSYLWHDIRPRYWVVQPGGGPD
jgi:hypothetical protein